MEAELSEDSFKNGVPTTYDINDSHEHGDNSTATTTYSALVVENDAINDRNSNREAAIGTNDDWIDNEDQDSEDSDEESEEETVRQYICEKCNKILRGRNGLKYHLKMNVCTGGWGKAENEDKYPCHICNKMFKTPGGLKYHKEQNVCSVKLERENSRLEQLERDKALQLFQKSQKAQLNLQSNARKKNRLSVSKDISISNNLEADLVDVDGENREETNAQVGKKVKRMDLKISSKLDDVIGSMIYNDNNSNSSMNSSYVNNADEKVGMEIEKSIQAVALESTIAKPTLKRISKAKPANVPTSLEAERLLFLNHLKCEWLKSSGPILATQSRSSSIGNRPRSVSFAALSALTTSKDVLIDKYFSKARSALSSSHSLTSWVSNYNSNRPRVSTRALSPLEERMLCSHFNYDIHIPDLDMVVEVNNGNYSLDEAELTMKVNVPYLHAVKDGKTGYFCNTGGPISVTKFVPDYSEDSGGDPRSSERFLAVGLSRIGWLRDNESPLFNKADETISIENRSNTTSLSTNFALGTDVLHTVGVPSFNPTLLHIWSVNVAIDNSSKPSDNVKVAYIIAFSNSGPVWKVDWCPVSPSVLLCAYPYSDRAEAVDGGDLSKPIESSDSEVEEIGEIIPSSTPITLPQEKSTAYNYTVKSNFSKEALGVAAIVLGNGKCCIAMMPRIDQKGICRSNNNAMGDVEGSPLVIDESEVFMLELLAPNETDLATTVSWKSTIEGDDYIGEVCVGYSSGVIAVFRDIRYHLLTASSNDKISAHLSFVDVRVNANQPCVSAVRNVQYYTSGRPGSCPHDIDPRNADLIISSGYDCIIRIWDTLKPRKPKGYLNIIEKGWPLDISWDLTNRGLYIAQSESGSVTWEQPYPADPISYDGAASELQCKIPCEFKARSTVYSHRTKTCAVNALATVVSLGLPVTFSVATDGSVRGGFAPLLLRLSRHVNKAFVNLRLSSEPVQLFNLTSAHLVYDSSPHIHIKCSCESFLSEADSNSSDIIIDPSLNMCSIDAMAYNKTSATINVGHESFEENDNGREREDILLAYGGAAGLLRVQLFDLTEFLFKT